ncbi:MAG: hypothetical protein CMO81_04060 [Waddliaceae bacterium]|nr:hypothetical protein [Waddliaceae bacterium]
MKLLLTMLPIYLVGNLHCIGMCGPLAMLLSRHTHRNWYFIGRLFSFSLAGLIAGGIGWLFVATLKQGYVTAALSIGFGALIFLLGLSQLFHTILPINRWLSKKSARVTQSLTLLISRDHPWATFLFGLFTIALPCGQTLIVYSACALSASAWEGFINGFAFALLTSPALILAMNANKLLRRFHQYQSEIMGSLACLVGMLSILRGFADLEWIPHLVLSSEWHFVIY